MHISKDIQQDLVKITEGMEIRNIYSQMAYFLVDLATQRKNPRTHGHELTLILGLISDSYMGKVSCGILKELKQDEQY